MNKTMFKDRTAQTKINATMNKEDCHIYNTESESNKKRISPWSPMEDSKYAFKHRYISSSRSVPRRSKRFVKYKISRSLNFDENVHNSSSENSSLDENKYLSRSAKIMRALNFTNSPSYYGRTKIKRSLNFNLTPSPKRFPRKSKNSQKGLSLNLSSSSNGSNNILCFEQSPSDSPQSSLLFTSSESIDENQNETPSQQGVKGEESLNHSTPTATFNTKVLGSASFTPLLRSGLKQRIDNILYIAATPNTQALRSAKGRLKYTNDIVMSTPRNLFQDFHEEDDDDNQDSRPCTPENVIRLVPESMSAIKRSHKKERILRRSERCNGDSTKPTTDFANVVADTDQKKAEEYLTPQLRKYESSGHDSARDNSWHKMKVHNSEDDFSDTGSIFDYTDEKENVKKSYKMTSSLPERTSDHTVFKEHDNELEENDNTDEFKFLERTQNEVLQYKNREMEDLAVRTTNVETEIRPITPEPTNVALPESSQQTATPENRLNILQYVCRDSIKKSHKKSKDDNKKKLFTPKALQSKFEGTKQENNVPDRREVPTLKIELPEEENKSDPQEFDRATTPEKVNSSRLLLSQYSSVKKSHKKDKHNKVVSGFLKRQEYFNRDMAFADSTDDNISNLDASGYKSSIEDGVTNTSSCREDQFNDTTELLGFGGLGKENTSLDKLSPSKRKKPLDTSLEQLNSTDGGLSCGSELQECDSPKEEFQIFTPLKRRRSLATAPAAKEYVYFYQIPSGKEEYSVGLADHVCLPRCVTPVTHYPEIYSKSEKIEPEERTVKDEGEEQPEGKSASEEQPINDSSNLSGRSTPRNMSTTELYFNINSIKKSHKKNKRPNHPRKENLLKLSDSNIYADENEAPLSTFEDFEIKSDNRIGTHNTGESKTNETVEVEEDVLPINQERNPCTLNVENLPSTSTEDSSLNKTPPNSFKTKSYIRLLQQTSIKRSHKKIRDRKKHEVATADTHELSDDGSIFGDEEKLVCVEDESAPDMNNQINKRTQE